MSRQILFRNFELLEPSFGELRGGYQLLVEGDTVKELSETPIRASEAVMIDCGKRTLMPGLIDCHVHAIHSEVNVRFMEMLPLTLITARAASRLRAMLDRGFTTVRDTGGADWGIKTAIETGHITGPRLYIAGQSIAAIRIHAGAPILAANAPAATACNSNPPSPMARMKCANPRASRCARAPTMSRS
jgi:imidazolonepropionase-like amidohydrolase